MVQHLVPATTENLSVVSKGSATRWKLSLQINKKELDLNNQQFFFQENQLLLYSFFFFKEDLFVYLH